jgi:hypothetical protein
MQTLVFNTTTKTIKLYDGFPQKSEILLTLTAIPTVKVSESYYEVMQDDEFEKRVPVLRLPIANTNMVIEK